MIDFGNEDYKFVLWHYL